MKGLPEAILEDLVARFGAEQVLAYSQESDDAAGGLLELAVIASQPPSRQQARRYNIQLCRQLGRPAQVLFFSREDFEKESHEPGRMAYGIRSRGRLLFPS